MRQSFLHLPYVARTYSKLFCFKEDEGTDEGGTGAAGDPKVDIPGTEGLEEEFIAKPEEDLTKKFAAEAGTGVAAEDKDKKDPPAGDPPAGTEADKKDPPPAVVGDVYKPFAYLKGKYENVVLPAETEITPENQLEMFEKTIIENLDIRGLLDPNVAAIQDAIESGIPFQQAVAKYAPAGSSLTDDQKLAIYLKDRYGLTDEEVPGYIPKDEALLKREIKDADNYLNRKQELADKQLNAQREAEFRQKEAERATALEKDINTTIERFGKLDEVWGVKLSKEEKSNFGKTYRNWVTPGENGEPAPIMALLGNDDFLANVVFIASQPNRVKDLIDVKEEGLRKFYRSKLGLEPDIQHSGKTNVDTQELDMDAMRRPAKD